MSFSHFAGENLGREQSSEKVQIENETDTLRVKASDITAALDTFTCTVTREGDEYIIHLDKQEEA